MPKANHEPWDIKRFNQGANRDTEDEFVGALQDGEYIDADNMRPTADTGDQAALKKINGETIEQINNLGATTYKCIGRVEVNDKKIEFWADTLKAADSLIRIDGDVVLKSSDFPITVDNPLQIDKNESCIGGEIYITDNFNQPFVLNVQDMIDSFDSGSQKYLSEFEFDKYILALGTALDHPVFVSRESVGAGGGLPVGQYQYAIRFVTDDGDRTAFSVSTPLIPVPSQASSASDEYPYVKTVGADPAPSTQTSIGLRIRFRINNLLDYDFIEIKRVAYNAGQPRGTIPASEIIARIDISPQEISVKDFIDPVDQTQIPEVITDEEDTQQLSSIKKCKTLRYFEQRLHLMNIEFESRQIEDSDITFLKTAGQEMFEVIQPLGKIGYNDSFNAAYHQTYQRGERYGFGLVGYDDRGERTLAVKVPNFNNHLMPDRREEPSASTIANSPLGVPTAANVSNVVSDTFEAFDMVDAVTKDDVCEVKNILNEGDKAQSKVNKIFQNTGTGDSCSDISGEGLLNRVRGEDLGYQPYRPTTPADNTSSHDFRINTEVDQGAGWAVYDPKGYGPNYYGMGMALSGVDDLPNFMKAFSVVRTERADRVVAQGIGMYSLNKADVTNSGGRAGDSTKEGDKFWFFSPDMENGFVSNNIIQDMIDNPGNYEVQLVSPLGFFSEVFTGDGSAVNQHEGIDLVSYARVLFEDGSINIGDTTGSIGTSGYVNFGKWRNSTVSPNASGTTVYDMTGFSEITNKSGLQTFFELKIDQFVYATPSAPGEQDFDNADVKNFHEPWYMINIIQTGKNVPDTDITEYTETGHYQKIEAIIGKSDGVQEDYILVDERWEDCIPALDSSHAGASDDRFVFVEDTSGQQFKWYNITFKTAAQITTLIGTLATGEGLYRHTNVNNREFTINFNYPGFIPPNGTSIKIKYDNTVPIKVFGGDTIIGENIFSPLDNEYDDGGALSSPYNSNDNAFGLFNGWPYNRFEVSPRVYIINRTTGVNKVQDDNTIRMDFIRQMAIMFTCETRSPSQFYYSGNYPDQFFPHIHYVMRPHRWNTNDPPENIFDDYFTDYPSEEDRWIRGGLRYLPRFNIDYAKENKERSHTSPPKVGFEEQTEFCTMDIWSSLRPINVQDAPGVKTFPVANRFIASDDRGEIKYAFSAHSGKGHNLYAVCQGGLVLLLTNKRTLSNIQGDELTLIGGDESDVVQEQIWLSTDIGMNDEMWRSSAEWGDRLYWGNKNSVYKLEDNQIVDIGRMKYHSKLYNDILIKIRDGFKDEVTGVYDTLHNEYWLQAESGIGGATTFQDQIFLNDDGTFPAYQNLVITDEEIITLSGSASSGWTFPLINIITPPIVDGDINSFTVINGGTNELAILDRDAIQDPNGAAINIAFQLPFDKSIDDADLIGLKPGECALLTRETYTIQKSFEVQLNWSVTKVTDKLDKMVVFSELTQHWLGEFTHRFDKYLSFDAKMFGMKDGERYELNKGTDINGSPVAGSVTQASSMQQMSGKEFIRVRVASDNKPSKIEFFNDLSQTTAQSELDPSTNSLALKDYDGFEQYVPRKLSSVDSSRPRMQGRLLIYKIIHNLAESFKVIDAAINFKLLK